MQGRKAYLEGRSRDALDIFSDVRDQWPGFGENNYMLARSLYQSGRTEDAAELLQISFTKEQMDIDALKLTGLCYLEMGESAEALPYIQEALSRSEEDPSLHYLLARCFILEEEYDKAMVSLQTGEALLQRQIGIPLEMAKIYKAYGFDEKSLEILRRYAPFLDADHPLAPLWRGLIEKHERN